MDMEEENTDDWSSAHQICIANGGQGLKARKCMNELMNERTNER